MVEADAILAEAPTEVHFLAVDARREIEQPDFEVFHDAAGGVNFFERFSDRLFEAIAFAAQHDYEGFAQQELAERRALQWPPFVRLVFAGVMGRSRANVEAAIERYAELLRTDERWEVLGPATYPLARLNDEWRYRIAVKTRELDALRDALRSRVLPEAARSKDTRLVTTFEA